VLPAAPQRTMNSLVRQGSPAKSCITAKCSSLRLLPARVLFQNRFEVPNIPSYWALTDRDFSGPGAIFESVGTVVVGVVAS
jgi:hypothetical protein